MDRYREQGVLWATLRVFTVAETREVLQRLRVQDVEIEVRQVTVRSGKGDKDRVTVFPASLMEPLQNHLLEHGQGIRTIQELLGHSDVKTTMIYTHVLNRDSCGVLSPADLL